MTVKDVRETEGLVTTSGAPELDQYGPAADALAVRRLKDAGAIIFGPFPSDLRLLRIAEVLDAAAGPGFSAPPLT